MKAATVQSKKAISKGKLKKTTKNVLCRPDPIFWPVINEEHKQLLEKSLNEYAIETPVFQKLHWKDIKLIPKEERRKPPKLKIEGLFFGISECCNALKSQQCAAVIIEASVNPRIIVQPVLEACIKMRIPALCVSDLRTITARNFHIPTSCLGIKKDFLEDLHNVVLEISKSHELPQSKVPHKLEEPMEITPPKEINNTKSETTLFPYLHRTDKKSRVFVPSGQKQNLLSNINDFIGQDFIEFSEKPDKLTQRNAYMKMIVKRISNNPNRVKPKKENNKKN